MGLFMVATKPLTDKERDVICLEGIIAGVTVFRICRTYKFLFEDMIKLNEEYEKSLENKNEDYNLFDFFSSCGINVNFVHQNPAEDCKDKITTVFCRQNWRTIANSFYPVDESYSTLAYYRTGLKGANWIYHVLNLEEV